MYFHAIEQWKPKQFYFPASDTIYWGTLHLYTLGAALGASTALGFTPAKPRSYYLEDLRRADRLYQVARALSVLFGLLTVGLAFRVGQRLFGDLEGLLMASLAAWIPVQVLATLYAKVDCLLLFWGFAVMGISHHFFERSRLSDVVWAGVLCGLAAATKYTGGIFLILPLVALAMTKTFTPKRGLVLFGGLFLGFVVGCPLIVLHPSSVTHMLARQFIGSTFTASSAGYAPWALEYPRYYWPYAYGLPLTALIFAALPVMAFSRQTTDRWLLISFGIVYLVLTHPRRQFLLYTVLLLPFLIPIVSRALTTRLPWSKKVIPVFLLAMVAVSVSAVSLFWKKDPRVRASEWIETHVSTGTDIGILKSFYWTPPVLRARPSPYGVLDPSNDDPTDEILGQRLTTMHPSYFVLTEPELRDARRLPALTPKVSASLTDLTEHRYSKVAAFETRPLIPPLPGTRRAVPWDWAYTAPYVEIYQRKD